MSQTIKLKRSAVAGKVPTTSNLDLGEIALNTNDGKVFFKKDDGSPSIQTIVTTDSQVTGSIELTGALTASAISGSFIGDGSGITGTTIFISGADANGTEVTGDISTLFFDADTGLNVTSVDGSVGVVGIGSHFKNLFVDGSTTITAEGSDDLDLIAGSGIDLGTSLTDTNGNGVSKELSFAVDDTVARTGSNSFTGDQDITGAITASSAKFANLNYPTSDGAANTVIGTDGNGNLSFISPSATSAFPYEGNAEITGSLTVSGSTFTNIGQAVFEGRISLDDGGQNLYIGKNAGIQDDLTNNKNIGIGEQALRFNTGGNTNIAIGYQSLRQNLSGDDNIGIGYRAGYNIRGNRNIAIGFDAMLYSNSVDRNTAIGYIALHLNTAGSENTSVGYASLFRSTGEKNTALGSYALQEMSSGDINTAIGYEAGHYISNGANNTNSTGSVFLGANTSPSGSGETNQIVIGYNATGLGSNTAVLGNDDITTTVLKGNVGIGTTSPSDKLTVAGVIKSIGGSNDAKYAQIYANDNFGYFTTNASTIFLSTELQVNTGRIGSYDEDLFLETSGTTRITVNNSTGNVGIGTTSPTRKLDVESSEAVITDFTGTSATSQSFVDIENTSSGDNLRLGIFTGGIPGITTGGGTTPTIAIDPDNNNNVGIGTTSPYYKLHLNYSDTTTAFSGGGSGNWGGNGLRIENTTSTTGAMSVAHFRVYDSDWHIGNRYVGANQSDFFFKHENTEYLTLLNNGNVGIGTTSPDYNLEVNGDIGVGQYIYHNGDNNTHIRFTVDSISLQAGGRQIIRMDEGADPDKIQLGDSTTTTFTEGQVGIGTDNPSSNAKLHLSGSGFVGMIIESSDSDTDLRFVGNRTYIIQQDGNGSISNTDSLVIRDNSAATNRVVIDPNGNVGIGTGASTPASKLTVEGNVSASGVIYSEGAVQANTFRADDYPSNSFLKFNDDQGFASNMTTLGSIGGMNFIIDTNDNDDQQFTWWHGSTDVDSATQLMDLDENGNLTVTGIITAQEFHTEFVSASIIYQSGSTKFGDTSDDVHSFTGSLEVSGSTSVFHNTTIFEDGMRVGTGNHFTDGRASITFGEGATTTDSMYIEYDGENLSNDSNGIFIGSSKAGVGDVLKVEFGGNVGIGTPSPDYRFHAYHASTNVVGQFESGDNQAWVSVRDDGYTTYGAMLGCDSDNGEAIILADNGANKRLVIDNSGNVGIGTTDPSFGPAGGRLAVRYDHDYASTEFEDRAHLLLHNDADQGADSKAVLLFHTDTTGGSSMRAGIVGGNNNAIPRLDFYGDISNLSPSTTPEMTIIGGNVGIGTESPSYALDIERTTGEVAIQLQARDNSSNSSIYFGDNGDADVGSLIYNHASNYMAFTANANERMRIDSSGNVGIGTTSPGNKLHVYRNSTQGSPGSHTPSNATLQIQDSSNSLYLDGNSIIGTGAGTLHVGNASNTAMNLWTNGENRLHIEAGGNIGIGTTSPNQKLTVAGNISGSGNLNIDGTATVDGVLNVNSYIYIDRADERMIVMEDSGGSNTGYLTMNDSQGNMQLMLGVDGDGHHVQTGDGAAKLLYTAHTQDGVMSMNAAKEGTAGADVSFSIGLSIDSNDNTIKVGASNDNVGLDSGGNTVFDASGNLYTENIYARNANGLNILDDSGTLGIFVEDGGNVGIGTTSPDRKLHISDTGTLGTQVQINGTNDSAGIKFIPASGDNWEVQANINNKWFVYNRTDEAYRFVIDGSGNVGIGTTNPSPQAGSDTTLVIEGSGSPSLQLNDTGQAEPWGLFANGDGLRTYYGTDIYMSVKNNGNVGIGTTSPSTKLEVNGTATVTSLVETSTRELKKDITELEDQSTIVDSLQPVTYTWKESEEEDFGLIAEDVQGIAPHLVKTDLQGKPVGIKYSKLSVLLLDVVQRQNTLIEDLNERITKLENERG